MEVVSLPLPASIQGLAKLLCVVCARLQRLGAVDPAFAADVVLGPVLLEAFAILRSERMLHAWQRRRGTCKDGSLLHLVRKATHVGVYLDGFDVTVVEPETFDCRRAAQSRTAPFAET